MLKPVISTALALLACYGSGSQVYNLSDAVAVSAPAYSAADLNCLAMNIYWEARSESLDGQLAVAAVTMNRVQSKRFPDNVCDVVHQGGEDRLHRCQFSWWCDGKSDRPREMTAWESARGLAHVSLSNEAPDPTNGATHYHASYVQPGWSRQLQLAAVIGEHNFYTNQRL